MEQYIKWKQQIKDFMLAQGETLAFVNYVHDWFDGIKGKYEIQLLQEFHPDFANKDDDETLEFISSVRSCPRGLPNEEFAYQIFNSAFSLYRPYLKLQYLKEQQG